MINFFYKLGVYVLGKHELNTLESFCVGVWTQHESVAVTPALEASNNLLNGGIFLLETSGP